MRFILGEKLAGIEKRLGVELLAELSHNLHSRALIAPDFELLLRGDGGSQYCQKARRLFTLLT